MQKNEPNPKMVRLIWIITVAVFGVVVALHELPAIEPVPVWVKSLPLVNAVINSICFVLLIASLWAIKKFNVALHMRFNVMAMVLSLIFLLTYVLHHTFAGNTVYEGDYQGLYFFVLITHIILAAVSFPFILLSFYYGYIGAVVKHRKMVKYVFPVWLYVAFTGPVVYAFLAPYYA